MERVIALPDVADISAVGALTEQLRELVTAPEPVVVDASRLQRADAATLQALLAFVRERRPQGLAVHWRGSSAPLSEAARLLGLGDALDLDPSPVSEPN